MMRDKFRVLLVDDDEDEYILINDMLEEANATFEVEWVDRYDVAREKMLKGDHDLYLVDYYLEVKTGKFLLEDLRSAGMMRPIIILTGLGGSGLDQDVLEAGAADYLPKADLTPALLERSVRYAIGRQQSYKKLIEERSRYRTLFTNSLDAVALLSANFELKEVNTAFEKLTGKVPNEDEPVFLKSIIANETDLQPLLDVLESDTHLRNYNLAINGTNGVLECLVSMAANRSEEQQISGYQLILHDITQTKAAEREIQLAEKISFTGRMAQLMAHEVRNPLTNVNLAIQQLAEIDSSEPDEQELLLSIVKRSTDRISSLINQILDSSKPTQLDRTPTMLREVVSQSLTLSKDLISLNEVAIDDESAQEDIKVLLDLEKMSLAVVNLISNAIEAMREVDSRKLTFSISCNEGRAELAVTDTGKGMTPEQQKAVFEPFFTARKGGKGLGMTLTKNLVSGHEGAITVESEVGVGTTFVISLPACES